MTDMLLSDNHKLPLMLLGIFSITSILLSDKSK